MFSDVCREMHFLSSVTDKVLVGHVIRKVKVNIADQCEIRCYEELECLSYNLGPYHDNGHVCELSNSDHLRHPNDLVPMPGFIYRGTEVHDLMNFAFPSIQILGFSFFKKKTCFTVIDSGIKFTHEGHCSIQDGRENRGKNISLEKNVSPWSIPYNALYREAPPERDAFFKF